MIKMMTPSNLIYVEKHDFLDEYDEINSELIDERVEILTPTNVGFVVV